jgi:probable rRNA maturation factor
VNIAIRNLQKKIPITRSIILGVSKAIRRVVATEGSKKNLEITVCFVNNAKIKRLNKKYFGKSYTTDCLAFEIGKNLSQDTIADIVISTETAINNAKIFKTTPIYEVYLYAIHGTLHILGYKDKNKKYKKIMDLKSARILTWLANKR